MFDRFDIMEAWYVYLSINHEGQGSEKYARLCKLSTHFAPRMSLSADTLSANGKEIFEAIDA